MSLQTTISNFGPIKWLIGKAAGKARLWLEYAIIAALVAALGFALSTWFQSKVLQRNVQTLSGHVGGLSVMVQEQAAINIDQSSAILKLNALRDKDDKARSGLEKLLTHNNLQDRTIRQKLAELEKTNEDAKKILGAHVPSSLSCLLDDTPCPGRDAAHAGTGSASATGADGSVH